MKDMKIVAWNVNGLRAIHKKNFLEWLKQVSPDILCLQEIKAEKEKIPAELLDISGYFTFVNSAQRKGYSGVLTYSKEKPLKVNYLLSEPDFDQEGRLIELVFKDLIVINVYMPNGGREQERFPQKFSAYKVLIEYLGKIKDKKVAIVGDFNVAHQEIDIARPKENQKNTGFTLAERKEIDKLIEAGYVDSFRHLNPTGGHYTWWAPFAQARIRNIGWRIDYVFASKALMPQIKEAFIWPQVMGSDHCPVGVEII
ncbi:MAG: exodeoxyribonuclease III [Candidatus Gribaldobacteria bacterium]|nr:exodeoxyribonuclease III [Candidatus Gribaldobacteria bacterium]